MTAQDELDVDADESAPVAAAKPADSTLLTKPLATRTEPSAFEASTLPSTRVIRRRCAGFSPAT